MIKKAEYEERQKALKFDPKKPCGNHIEFSATVDGRLTDVKEASDILKSGIREIIPEKYFSNVTFRCTVGNPNRVEWNYEPPKAKPKATKKKATKKE